MTRIDDVLEVANAAFSIMFAINFAIESLSADVKSIMQGVSYTPYFIVVADIFLIIILLADWVLFFYLHHEDRIAFLFSMDSFINSITIIPTALIRFQVITN